MSSGDSKKSIKIEGKIKTKGEPFTITAILPSNKALETLSDLSVESTCGKGDHFLSWINCSNCPRGGNIIYIQIINSKFCFWY